MSFKQLDSRSIPWFSLGLVVIFLISLSLRFWGLGRFNTLVFDEVYYAIFANDYLTHTPFFNAHPPLSQYLIAIGIWVGNHLPFGKDTINGLTGSQISTFSYRWLNALTGSFVPLVIAGIAYQLIPRRSYALIAALFAAADGLFLVESRYALNNIYLVLFGLLGQWFFLLALKNQATRRWVWLTLAGVFFGASAAIKWNGLWFLLGAYLIWISAWVIQLVSGQHPRSEGQEAAALPSSNSPLQPLSNLTQLNFFHIIWNLGIIPIAVYSVAWIPHLQLNPNPNFWEMQKEILFYHERIGNGAEVHPYCANWYTWPLMIRPIAYFYQTSADTSGKVPDLPPLPGQTGNVIYDVHAMGNPILWWLSTAAILLVLLLLVQRLFRNGTFPKTGLTSSTAIALYLVLNYAANLLPWMKVTRCIFLYHYMGASVFAGLALAWIVDRWINYQDNQFQKMGIATIILVVAAFIFWMPIYLGLPLSAWEYQLRMWLPTWI